MWKTSFNNNSVLLQQFPIRKYDDRIAFVVQVSPTF